MVELGDKVKDTVSGYEGIAIVKHEYLYGCDRFSIQAEVQEPGCLPDLVSFDVPQLIVLEARDQGLLPIIPDVFFK